MLKQIFPLLFTLIFSINLFAESHDIHSQILSLNLQIQEIKLSDERDEREKKIEKLETDIKKLEDEFNKNNVDKKEIDGKLEKTKDIIDRQDLRLDDLNFYLALYGFLITILLFVASYLSYRFTSSNANEIVQNWIKNNKEEILEPIRNEAKDLQKNIEKEALYFYQEKLKEFRIEDKLDESQKKNQKLILEKVNEILEKKEKNEYTFDDWYSKFLTFKNDKKHLDRALYFLEKAWNHTNTDIEKVRVLFNKGYFYGRQEKFSKSIETYNILIDKFKNLTDTDTLWYLKTALMNKIEINLILDKTNSKEDLDLYFELIKDKKEELLKFEMLQIIEKAKKLNQDKEIKEWQVKYKDTKLVDWSFDELKTWVEKLEKEPKERILRYIKIFENHNK